MAQGDSRLGHADAFDEVPGGLGDHDPAGVGVADVFGCENCESSGDESWVFARVEHAGDPVDGGVGVGAADGLDHGGDGVVVPVVAVGCDLLLDGILSELLVDDQG